MGIPITTLATMRFNQELFLIQQQLLGFISQLSKSKTAASLAKILLNVRIIH